MNKYITIRHIVQVITVLVAGLAMACSGRQKPRAASAVSAQSDFVPIEVPDKVAVDEISVLETELFGLPDQHPQRRLMRNRLCEAQSTRFSAIDENEEAERLSIYKDLLTIHAPADFKENDFCDGLALVARWVVDHFEPQGKEALVLSAMRVLAHFGDNNHHFGDEYLALLDWSQSVRETISDPIERFSSLSNVLDKLIELAPDQESINRLTEVLAERQQAVMAFLHVFSRSEKGISPYIIQNVLKRGSVVEELALAYFMGGRIDQLADALVKRDLKAGISDDVWRVISGIANKDNLGFQYYQLAALFGARSAKGGMRACMMAMHEAPDEPRYALCAGRFLFRDNRPVAAVKYYMRAAAAGDEPAVVVQSMELMQEALFKLHTTGGQLGPIEEGLAQAEALVQQIEDMEQPAEQLVLAASSLIELVASIEYDDGNIPAASAHFRKAATLWPSRPSPRLKLAEIDMAAGRYDDAAALLDDVFKAKEPVGGAFAGYWKAILLETRGDCARLSGDPGGARRFYETALKSWKTADYPADQSPNISIRKGVLLHRLGEKEKSLQAFRKAVALSPQRRSSYADILSFLVIEGRAEDAAEFYAMAFNQDTLDTMWKIYFSIWMEGAARRAGQSDELAHKYLLSSDGDSWQETLARFFTGRIDARTLHEKASTKGEQVEADYYEALYLLVNDSSPKKRVMELLQNVLDSQLLAFFEYRMAKQLVTEL